MVDSPRAVAPAARFSATAARNVHDTVLSEDGATSAAHRLGGPRDALLTDPPEYWQLRNTPF